jgi:hypothetical protein
MNMLTVTDEIVEERLIVKWTTLTYIFLQTAGKIVIKL